MSARSLIRLWLLLHVLGMGVYAWWLHRPESDESWFNQGARPAMAQLIVDGR